MSNVATRNLQSPVPYRTKLKCLEFTGDGMKYTFSGIDTLVEMSKIRELQMAVDWRGYVIDNREICGGESSGSYSFEVGKTGKYGLGASNYSNMSPSELDTIVWSRVPGEKPILLVNGKNACVDTLLREPIGTFKIPMNRAFPVHLKLFKLLIKDHNGDVVFNAFPVEFDNDGHLEAGLYDIVSNKIFANVGNVPFANEL